VRGIGGLRLLRWGGRGGYNERKRAMHGTEERESRVGMGDVRVLRGGNDNTTVYEFCGAGTDGRPTR
jgi:hypothetical protein